MGPAIACGFPGCKRRFHASSDHCAMCAENVSAHGNRPEQRSKRWGRARVACSAGRMLARLEQEEYSSRRRFADGFSRELAKEEGDGASGEIATHTRSVARFGYAAKPATAREPRPFLASLPADDVTKQGKVTVRYPRGAEAEEELHAEAVER